MQVSLLLYLRDYENRIHCTELTPPWIIIKVANTLDTLALLRYLYTTTLIPYTKFPNLGTRDGGNRHSDIDQ